MNPILFIDLFKQASYKTTILLSVMYKQRTYFSKKYSRSIKITLSKINKLSKICEKDNIKATKYVHKKINLITYDNFMLMCVKSNNVKIVRYFLNIGYNIKTIIEIANCRVCHTLFSFGSLNGCTKIIKLLLDKYEKSHNNMYCDEYYLILTYCSEYGHINILKLLLSKGVIDTHNTYSKGALLIGAYNGYVNIVKLLFNYGINTMEVITNALNECAYYGHCDVAKFLINKGANIHNIDRYLLEKSIERGYVDFVKLLLENGANIQECNNNEF